MKTLKAYLLLSDKVFTIVVVGFHQKKDGNLLMWDIVSIDFTDNKTQWYLYRGFTVSYVYFVSINYNKSGPTLQNCVISTQKIKHLGYLLPKLLLNFVI